MPDKPQCDESLDLIFSQQGWQQVIDARQQFIMGQEDLARQIIRPFVYASWQRCKRAGITPEQDWLCLTLSDEEYDRIRDAYRPLINTVETSIGLMDDLQLSNDYIFELIARNGMPLISSGNFSLHPVIADRSIFSEQSMGTNAHSLCMRRSMATQIFGPEHYCNALLNLMASAAPLRDEKGTVLASLVLTQPLPAEPWSTEYHRLANHTIGLLASMATTIENQLQFKRYYARIEIAREHYNESVIKSEQIQQLLETTLDTSSENILVLDSLAQVQKVSPGVGQLLKTNTEDLINKVIPSALNLNWPEDMYDFLNEAANKIIFLNGSHYLLSATPISNEKTHLLECVVVKLSDVGTVISDDATVTFAPTAITEQKLPATVKIDDGRPTTGRRSGAGKHEIGELAGIVLSDILGPSKAIQKAKERLRKFANGSGALLICGESGTGKEYFSQAAHNLSRPNHPFMSINCAAIPQNLIESELFGYEGGSFTGAAREGRPGKIELADGGTLFLDEIGDMPFDLQSTLLRVLESKSVMRLGAKRYKSVDFRVISATNRDLLQAVREGKFREDLYYRLSVLTIELPPLRERRDDILFFVRYYLDNWNSDNHAQQLVLSDEAMELLLAYEWPGNIRQLRNCLLAACHLATNGQIEADDLPAGITSNSSAILSEAGGKSSSTRSNTASAYTDLISEATSLDLEYVEQKAIAEALRRANGNMTKAARLLGVSKATLYRKIKE